MPLPPFLGGFQPALQNNSDSLLQLGAGLLGGRNQQEQLAGGIGGFAQSVGQTRQRNKTVAMLRAQGANDLADAIDSGALSGGDAYKLFYSQKLEAQKPKNNYLTVGKNLYDLDNKQWISPPAGMAGNDDNYFGTVVKGYDPQGNPVYLQPGKDGSVNQLKLPEGFKPENKFDKVDLGDSWMIRDNTNGSSQIMPKNLANAESQKEIGSANGKAVAAAPGDLQAAQNAIDMVESIRNDPNKGWGTGFTSIFNSIPGSSGKGFQKKVDQATSGAFLTAIQQMRGLGSLSNAEGGAATDAVNRMDTATREEDFNAALDDYEKIVRQGAARAQARIQQSGGQVQPPPGIQAPGATSSGVKWSIEP